MGRLYFYMMAIIMLSILLTIVGTISPDNANSGLKIVGVDDIVEGEVTSYSSLYIDLFGSAGLLIIGLTVGIAVTFFARSSSENYLMLPFITGTLALFVGSLWNIMIITNGTTNWIRIPIWAIMIPFTIGYIITLAEWFRGNI